MFADNVRAIRSYEKAGFVREADLKDDVCINGKYRDIVLMAVLNHEPAPGNEQISDHERCRITERMHETDGTNTRKLQGRWENKTAGKF